MNGIIKKVYFIGGSWAAVHPFERSGYFLTPLLWSFWIPFMEPGRSDRAVVYTCCMVTVFTSLPPYSAASPSGSDQEHSAAAGWDQGVAVLQGKQTITSSWCESYNLPFPNCGCPLCVWGLASLALHQYVSTMDMSHTVLQFKGGHLIGKKTTTCWWLAASLHHSYRWLGLYLAQLPGDSIVIAIRLSQHIV